MTIQTNSEGQRHCLLQALGSLIDRLVRTIPELVVGAVWPWLGAAVVCFQVSGHTDGLDWVILIQTVGVQTAGSLRLMDEVSTHLRCLSQPPAAIAA